MKAFILWLAGVLSDGENPSSSRVIAVITLLALYLAVISVWAGLSIYNHRLEEVPASVLGLIGAVSGPLLAFVHYNKKIDQAAP